MSHMFRFCVLLMVLSLIGCGTYYAEDNKPMTDKERLCVQVVETDILSKTPKTLSGHDQDWDDAIKTAHKAACKSCCPSRLFEYDRQSQLWTGKYKEIE